MYFNEVSWYATPAQGVNSCNLLTSCNPMAIDTLRDNVGRNNVLDRHIGSTSTSAPNIHQLFLAYR